MFNEQGRVKNYYGSSSLFFKYLLLFDNYFVFLPRRNKLNHIYNEKNSILSPNSGCFYWL